MSETNKFIKFVQLIEQYECLYNYYCNEYSRKDYDEKAWTEISTEIKCSGEYFITGKLELMRDRLQSAAHSTL